MRVTVDLTDEQADYWVSYWYEPKTAATGDIYGEIVVAFREAIVAARPHPLAVGDLLDFPGGGGVTVLSFGVDGHKNRWMVLDGYERSFIADPQYYTMADGSPIVWPES